MVLSQNVVGKRTHLRSGGCLLQISEIKSKKQRELVASPHQRCWGGLSLRGGAGGRQRGRGAHGHAQCELRMAEVALGGMWRAGLAVT